MTACSAWLCSANGPGVWFGPWPLWFYDTLRVLCQLGGLGIVVLTLAALRHGAHGASWGQQSRWLATMMFAVSVIGTEIEHLGDWASWRLVINLLGVLGALYGLVHLLRHESSPANR